MPTVGPIKRQDLIRFLRKLGFEGPYSGSKHAYMVKGQFKLRIPNPHQSDISRNLLMAILREAGIDKDEWEKL